MQPTRCSLRTPALGVQPHVIRHQSFSWVKANFFMFVFVQDQACCMELFHYYCFIQNFKNRTIFSKYYCFYENTEYKTLFPSVLHFITIHEKPGTWNLIQPGIQLHQLLICKLQRFKYRLLKMKVISYCSQCGGTKFKTLATTIKQTFCNYSLLVCNNEQCSKLFRKQNTDGNTCLLLN